METKAETAGSLNGAGFKLPLIGLGLSGIFQPDSNAVIEQSVESALAVGYRHFDTAYSYLNETPIGNALARAIQSGKVRRDEFFITTKLPGIGMHPERVEKFLRKSLGKLQMDYVDLFLIHWPLGFYYSGDDDEIFPKTTEGKLHLDHTTDLEAIWVEMERMQELGLTKAIGLSNFNEKQIQRIINISKIRPVALQIELNAYFQQRELVSFCKQNGIQVCAYAPLGSPGRKQLYKSRGLPVKVEDILDDETVKRIAESRARTPAQILLRFLVQQEISIIPKTTQEERLRTNFQVTDFQLSSSEMEELRNLDKGPQGRTFDLSSFPEGREHPECPF